MLVYYFREEMAAQLQRDFATLLELLENNMDDIWVSKPKSGVNEQNQYGPDATVQSIIAQRQKTNVNNTTNGKIRFSLTVWVVCAWEWLVNFLDKRSVSLTEIYQLRWLTHSVSRFAWYKGDSQCEFEFNGFSCQNFCNNNLVSNHQVNKQKLTSHHQSNGNSIRW